MANSNHDPGKLPRLSRKEFLILELLLGHVGNGMYGLELVRNSDGALKRGTVYVTLARMEDKGYIESRTEDISVGERRLPRRFYKPTGHGARVFEATQIFAQAVMV